MSINKGGYYVPTGDNPQVNFGTQISHLPFFTDGSNLESAHLLEASLKPGFGIVPMGTVLAVTGDGYHVPYPPIQTTTFEDNVAITVALVDVGATDTEIFIPNDEATKYAVNDVLILANAVAVPEYHDCGAITAIDVEGGRTKLTITTAVVGTNFTVANNAHVYIKSGTASPFKDPLLRIMYQGRDTGSSLDLPNAGGLGECVISNAYIWKHAVWNLDTATASAFGNLLEDLGNNKLILR